MSLDTKSPSDPGPALELANLEVRTGSDDVIVEGIDLRLRRGEILGLVGESGSGKSTSALSLLGYAGSGAHIASGSLTIAGLALRMDESMRDQRGSLISYIPQDPGGALNPALRIGDSLRDVVARHRPEQLESLVPERLFEAVGLPGTPEFARRLPHQLSGGQQQRVCIAVALACEPEVLVLDEPTTGLDVVTQAKVIAELLRLRDERGVAMVYVSHDLAVVAQIADSVAVLYGGRVVEHGPARTVLQRPRHPYTRGLLASSPDHLQPRSLEAMPGIAVGVGERGAGCVFAPRCGLVDDGCREREPDLAPVGSGHLVRCHHADRTAAPVVALPPPTPAKAVDRRPVLEVEGLVVAYRSRRETVVAASDISFSVAGGACVALVGESGSGKTTIARTIAGLHDPSGGEIRLGGETLPKLARRRTVEQRRRVQLVFQNPASALNPQQTVRQQVARPAQLLRGLRRAELGTEVDRLLDCVRLPGRLAARYPSELSGGERQRVAIARALAADPELIVCDEITSALDVSVQAAVLGLLQDLRAASGLSLLFITHDLGVVATVADEVLVLERGSICERGATAEVMTNPAHPYTRSLLHAAPSVSGALTGWAAGSAS